jgi:hypothetical protein
MQEKEEKSVFYIAWEHWQNTMLTTAVIGLIVIGIPYYLAIIDIDNLGWWPIIISPALIWVGTRYSSKRINRWYDFQSGHQIAILSTIYFAFAVILGIFIDLLTIKTLNAESVSTVFSMIVFYFESSRSLGTEKEDSESENDDVEEDYYTM